MRCWCSIRLASSWLTPSRTVTRFSCVISSETFCLRIGGKAHVAVGEDADQLAGLALAAAGDHGNAGDAVILHQRQRIRQRRVGADGQRIDHHAGFVLLHLPHLGGLALRIEIAVDHADAAGLRHGDRHARLGDGVHGGGDDRDVERDGAGDAGADIDFGRQHIRKAGLQQHVVEGKASRMPEIPAPSSTPFCGRRPRSSYGMSAAFGEAMAAAVESMPIGGVDEGR